MRPPLSLALFSITIFAPLRVALSEPAQTQKIRGRVVAYADGLTCLNGNAYWSMLIRVPPNAVDAPGQFIQVRFSLPCKDTPKWLDRKSPVQKFHLKRERGTDSVLKEFLDCASDATEPCPKVPMWRLVPGTQKERLPFGHMVPSYRSVDLPLVPVV